MILTPNFSLLWRALMSEVFATTGTIAAIATAVVPQQGSVGIVRVSGSQAMALAQTLFHAPGRQVWESHQILYGTFAIPRRNNW